MGETVGHVDVLHVGCAKAELAVNGLNVERKVAPGRTVPLAVLGGKEVSEVGMIGPFGPAPVRREPDIVSDVKLVRGLEWMPDSRGRVRFRGLVLPAVLDAPLTCEGPILHDPEVGSIVPAPLQELCVVKALAEKGGAGLRLSLDGVPNQHANSDPRPQDKHFYFYHSLLFRLEE